MISKEKPQSAMSAQVIFQDCSRIRSYQYFLKENSEDEKLKVNLARLTKKIKTEIEVWGGVAKIDAWLKANDPRHELLSDIEEMDWNWLG